ncbi:MAG: hypothetical protein M3N27_05240 [Thermoproteota archaeon]|nr:hypothetical protein [Thermoproteota archaeon]
MKYGSDSLHMQGTSSKRDLVGGFIERWLNKLAETAIFDSLFDKKPYDIVPDYFLYNNESQKNAPDILGIKDKNKTMPFVQYNDGKWETVGDSPRIEVKALRKDQYLLGIRQPQMIDDYYVFVESDLSPDYLTMIFDEEVFSDKNLELLKVDPIFIKSDINSSIIAPEKPKRAEVVGSFRLIGTYTKKQILENTVSCKPKVSPWYVKSVLNVDRVTRSNEGSKINIVDNKFTYEFGSSIYLPVSIEGNTKNVLLIKSNKGSFFLRSENELTINGTYLKPGFIKVEFSEFKRGSAWDENLAVKNSFEVFAKDSTDEMINTFDELYNKLSS